MNDLQCRRIKHAASMALNIDDRLDEVDKAVRLIRDRLENLTEYLRVILRVIREADEAEADEARAFAGASARAEVTALKEMLAHLPEGSVIDRMSLEARLAEVQASVDQSSVEEALCDRMGIPKETPPTTPETAAGPWEPYSDEAYARLRDKDGVVNCAWPIPYDVRRSHKLSALYRMATAAKVYLNGEAGSFQFSDGWGLHHNAPTYIARIIPPQEAAADAE